MPIALDLYCCQGGASQGLAAAGFRVIGIDIVPQPKYPFPFIRAGAITTLQPDFIWASPPCQAHTLAQRIQGRDHPDLIAPTRTMLRASGIPYVIENVPGAPLEKPILLCGAMFGLQTYRHRLFECSFAIEPPEHPEHVAPIRKMGRPVQDNEMMHVVGDLSGVQKARGIMETPWINHWDGLREAVPPAFSEYIGRAALAAISLQAGGMKL